MASFRIRLKYLEANEPANSPREPFLENNFKSERKRKGSVTRTQSKRTKAGSLKVLFEGLEHRCVRRRATQCDVLLMGSF
jgi:hypothetical protein